MSEHAGGSVTLWIQGMKAGDGEALSALWARYFRRVVALARLKMRGAAAIDGPSDEEDVALSALFSLYRRASLGSYPRLEDRDDFWRMLAVITARKAADLHRRQGRLKRGGGSPAVRADPGDRAEEGWVDLLAQVAADVPGPEIAAMLAEEYRLRLSSLGDDVLRRVAELRLDGYSNDEIAETLGCARRTVARKLELIRDAWAGEAE